MMIKTSNRSFLEGLDPNKHPRDASGKFRSYTSPKVATGLPKTMTGRVTKANMKERDTLIQKVAKNITKKRALTKKRSSGFVSKATSRKVIERAKKHHQRPPGQFTKGTNTIITSILINRQPWNREK